jgi:hypothetical protein
MATKRVSEEEWLHGPIRRLFVHIRRLAWDRKTRLMYCGYARKRLGTISNPAISNAIHLAEGYAEGTTKYRKLLLARLDLDVVFQSDEYDIDLQNSLAWCCEPRLGQACCEIVSLAHKTLQAEIIRDVFGNAFHVVGSEQLWRSESVIELAKHIDQTRDFTAMPILGDLLEEAGCRESAIVNHCRTEQARHVRGCWVVDLALSRLNN